MPASVCTLRSRVLNDVTFLQISRELLESSSKLLEEQYRDQGHLLLTCQSRIENVKDFRFGKFKVRVGMLCLAAIIWMVFNRTGRTNLRWIQCILPFPNNQIQELYMPTVSRWAKGV